MFRSSHPLPPQFSHPSHFSLPLCHLLLNTFLNLLPQAVQHRQGSRHLVLGTVGRRVVKHLELCLSEKSQGQQLTRMELGARTQALLEVFVGQLNSALCLAVTCFMLPLTLTLTVKHRTRLEVFFRHRTRLEMFFRVTSLHASIRLYNSVVNSSIPNNLCQF